MNCDHRFDEGGKCVKCNAQLVDSGPPERPQGQVGVKHYTYASEQATNCAGCGQHKHTPLRRDDMGGYVCLTCIDKELSSRTQAHPQPNAVKLAIEALKPLVEFRGSAYVRMQAHIALTALSESSETRDGEMIDSLAKRYSELACKIISGFGFVVHNPILTTGKSAIETAIHDALVDAAMRNDGGAAA